MLKFVTLGLAALVCSACLSSPSFAGDIICTGTEKVDIDQGDIPADPTDRIIVIPDVQVPGPAEDSPAARLEWNSLNSNPGTKLTASCYGKLFDAAPASTAVLKAGTGKCVLTAGTLTCQR